ncbi:MAG: FAD-dependent oxidoreductase [Lachnospiraceae bacterium]|jgi:2,4-dienoyl-CoA reductase-like NADH-dependent reductase (Old Yellow Enzyme family)/thioredoxin reductase
MEKNIFDEKKTGYEMLFSPMNIGTMRVKNRIVMAAAEFSLGQPSGCPTQKQTDYYVERAKGGVGLIIPGICRVNDMGGAASYTQLAMSRDYHIEPMREFAGKIHEAGAKLAIQLHHAGRQGVASATNSLPFVIPIIKVFPKVMNLFFKLTPVLLKLEEKGICFSMQAPSKCELSKHGATRIRAMRRREIKKLISDFINAAHRCKMAGVDAVELHAGHGYLLQQFLSPNTNLRTDEYGGNFENRLRFISEIIKGIKEKCGTDYPLIVRLTVDEFYSKVGEPGKGYDLETGKRIAKELEKTGVDAINVTCACYDTFNYWLEPTTFEPGWRKYLARAIKETVSIPVIAANVIRTPAQAEAQLREGCQDFVASGRVFICDPHWAVKAMEGREDEIRRCIGCLHCIHSFMENAKVGKPGECALNMSIAREKEYFNMPEDGAGKRAVVIGAGPAGLTAAETLLRRGFEVIVFEKEKMPGGQIIQASKCKDRERLYWCIENLTSIIKAMGGKIVFLKEITAREILDPAPDAVVVATGGKALRPSKIPGIDKRNVVMASEIIDKEKVISGSSVAVVGSGLTGLETCELLLDRGNSVKLIEMAPEIAPGSWFQLVDDLMQRMSANPPEIHLNTKLAAIEDDGVICEDIKTKTEMKIMAEYTVLALGVGPENALYEELKGNFKGKLLLAGDAVKSGTVASATKSAYEAVMEV